jgi:hypothetical protein
MAGNGSPGFESGSRRDLIGQPVDVVRPGLVRHAEAQQLRERRIEWCTDDFRAVDAFQFEMPVPIARLASHK